MHYRPLGATGIDVSVLGFGCGAVGGLMVRGEPAERVAAVARGLEAGITYFDTAPLYGNGLSEQHLGDALRELHADPYIGTKVRLQDADMGDIAGAIERSVEGSLQRLGRDSVTLVQLHNGIGARAQGGSGVTTDLFTRDVLPAFQRLVAAGKTRFFGITAVGDPTTLRAGLRTGGFHTAQVAVNLLNPSAAYAAPVPDGDQDFLQIIDTAQASGIGVIAIRVLAAGALSGVADRHAIASAPPAPIGSGPDYSADVARAQRLQPLVAEGYAADLVEASVRFARSKPGVSTVLVGLSELAHLEAAIAANEKGDLPPAALDRLRQIWAG